MSCARCTVRPFPASAPRSRGSPGKGEADDWQQHQAGRGAGRQIRYPAEFTRRHHHDRRNHQRNHIADRNDLLAAATDHIIARIVPDLAAGAGPRPALRGVAAGLFDAIIAHPWVGAQLTRDPLRPTLLDIYESISQQLQALGVPQRALPDSAGVLVNYILGVAGQNAANARALASSKMDRSAFLVTAAAQWAQLDPARYPSLHKASTQLPEHDDREQFLAGIDLILAGIQTVNRVGQDGAV